MGLPAPFALELSFSSAPVLDLDQPLDLASVKLKLYLPATLCLAISLMASSSMSGASCLLAGPFFPPAHLVCSRFDVDRALSGSYTEELSSLFPKSRSFSLNLLLFISLPS
jgi:hypothetical protein